MARTLAQRFWKWSQSWPVFLFMSAWLAAWAGLHLMPGRWWLDVNYIQVANAAAGQPVSMIVDREIRHEFYGAWSVHLRREKGTAGWETIACGTGANTYRTTSLLPTPVTLDWWTEGECDSLPPGRYQISTQWIIYPGSLWPPKTISVLSNVFEVTTEGQPERQD